MARVLMPLPSLDFDPTESAGSWLMLTEAGHRVEFATPDGRPGGADEIMLTGRGLDFWGFVRGLRNFTLLGKILGANRQARDAYLAMEQSHEFQNPQRWQDIQMDDYDALLLPGGHRARGMRRYLESAELQRIVLDFFLKQKPVAAICHGVLLAARAIDPATGRSVLYGRQDVLHLPGRLSVPERWLGGSAAFGTQTTIAPTSKNRGNLPATCPFSRR